MQFTVYRSSDGSAPVLSGTTGSLVAVLDAILVNGYGAKAAAGWAKTYAGTSKAVYRAASGTRHYLRVQDDGPGTGTFKEARITGYVTMSDVDTGTGPFPTAAQGVGGVAMLVVRKSVSADAVARAWICFADARTFYFFCTAEGTTTWISFAFGEYYSTKTVASTFNTIIMARTAENSATITNDKLDLLAAVTSALAGNYTPTNYAGVGASLSVGKSVAAGNLGQTTFAGQLTYPNTADGGLHMDQVWIHEITPSHRIGRLRGLYVPLHAFTFAADGSTFSGSGDLAGKTFQLVTPTGNNGACIFETSNTLETN